MHAPASILQSPSPHLRRAFTAIEMSLALVVAGLIGVCVVGLVGASGTIWRQQQEAGVGVTSGARAQSYLERVVRSAQDVGYSSPGSASEAPAMLLWAHDLLSKDDPDLRDHQIQACELLLIRYDSDARQIKLYRPIQWTDMTSAQRDKARETVSTAAFAQLQTANDFATNDWVEQHVLAGAAAGEQVTAAWWQVDRSSMNPIIRLRFELLRDGRTRLVYGTVSLRVPSKDDDWATQILQKETTAAPEPTPPTDLTELFP